MKLAPGKDDVCGPQSDSSVVNLQRLGEMPPVSLNVGKPLVIEGGGCVWQIALSDRMLGAGTGPVTQVTWKKLISLAVHVEGIYGITDSVSVSGFQKEPDPRDYGASISGLVVIM